MESEFENYDSLPNGWVYLFQVGDTAGLVCDAKKRQAFTESPLSVVPPAKGVS